MKRIALGAWILTGLAACDDPTRPAEPSLTPPAAAAVDQQFTVQSLGTLGGTFSEGNGINEQGEVAGWSYLPSGEERAFLWRDGQGMQSLGTLGGSESRARGINDATQVVGFSQIADGSFHAFLWTATGGIEDLGTLGGPSSEAFGISQTGEVVGTSETAEGNQEAFLWTREGGMRSLGTLRGEQSSFAQDINTHRMVVGHHAEFRLPFLWTPGRGMRQLPTLGGDQGLPNSLNEFGQIAGTSMTAQGDFRAALWTPAGGPLVVASEAAARSGER